MRIANNYYLIVDLEATCSDDGAVPRLEMEIIEIGAVMMNARTFEVESEFQVFVRPVRHPALTRFCMELTGITQGQVDDGQPFPKAVQAMTEWRRDFPDALFCSWGNYDRNQFLQDCEYHEIAYPFNAEHLNLKTAFAEGLGRRKPMGISGALKYLGLTFKGSPHRGLDDARNIAEVVRCVCS